MPGSEGFLDITTHGDVEDRWAKPGQLSHCKHPVTETFNWLLGVRLVTGRRCRICWAEDKHDTGDWVPRGYLR